jgi:hypothetical protein
MERILRSGRNAVRKSYGTLTAARRVLPDFVIIGTQRGGTTSLFKYLMQHPQVIGIPGKEIHFFDYQFYKGVRWYKSSFPSKAKTDRQEKALRKRVITGEASPYYLFHPHAPRRMAEIIPDVKLIVLLRNPVDRALSHYHHEISIKKETLSFEEAIDREEERLNGEVEKMLTDDSYRSFNHQHFSYLSRGIYVDQLIAYERYFDQDQMLILRSEDFFSDTQTTYDRVTDFLGLERSLLRNVQPSNVGTYVRGRAALEIRLQEYFQRHNQRLYEYLGIDFGW